MQDLKQVVSLSSVLQCMDWRMAVKKLKVLINLAGRLT